MFKKVAPGFCTATGGRIEHGRYPNLPQIYSIGSMVVLRLRTLAPVILKDFTKGSSQPWQFRLIRRQRAPSPSAIILGIPRDNFPLRVHSASQYVHTMV